MPCRELGGSWRKKQRPAVRSLAESRPGATVKAGISKAKRNGDENVKIKIAVVKTAKKNKIRLRGGSKETKENRREVAAGRGPLQ